MIQLFGYKPNKARRIAEARGKRHAKRGVEHCSDTVVERIIGKRPNDDPKTDEQLNQWYAATTPDADRSQWDADRNKLQHHLTEYPGRVLLRTVFICLLLIEFVAMSGLLATAAGMENPERSIVATGGALILFYLTKKAAPEEQK